MAIDKHKAMFQCRRCGSDDVNYESNRIMVGGVTAKLCSDCLEAWHDVCVPSPEMAEFASADANYKALALRFTGRLEVPQDDVQAALYVAQARVDNAHEALRRLSLKWLDNVTESPQAADAVDPRAVR